MITIKKHGRLGNIMLKLCAASILSKKFNLKIERYFCEYDLKILRPKFYKGGTIIHENKIEVKNNNFMNILSQSTVDSGLYLTSTCQRPDFVLEYKEEILNQFTLNYEQQHKDDLFVHVRLGDCITENRVPSSDYYVRAIERSKFNKGYISSDTPSNELVIYLMNKFNLTLYEGTPINTINFAKDFGSFVLSSGTFSWWMAFLSQSKSVFYPSGGPRWCGDIFVFDEWTPIDFK